MADAFDAFPDAPAEPAAAADPFAAFPDANSSHDISAGLESLGAEALDGLRRSPELLQRRADADTAALASAAAAPVAQPKGKSLTDYVMGGAKAAAQGAISGLDMLADAPVHLVNQAPRLLNINGGLVNKIMGREVVPTIGPISNDPLLPSDIIHAPDRALGSRKYEPQNPVERVIDRVGQEVGASMVPGAAALTAGAKLGVQGARALALSDSPIAALFAGPVEAAAANPIGMAGREASGAVAAGLGAGTANEGARAVTGKDSPVADLLGSLGGVSALALAKPIAGSVGNLVSAARGSPTFAADVAKESVANELIANSAHAQGQAARGVDLGALDVQPLADQLRRPSRTEEVIPGYQADIADRSGDAGLATYVFGHTAANPTADNIRRAANQGAVDDRMAALAPTGSAGQFRADLQGGVDRRLTAVDSQAEIAQRALEEHAQRLASTMTAEARGADIRAAVQGAADRAKAGVDTAYAPVNSSTARVDMAPLAESYDTLNRGMSVAERERFRPGEANIPRRLSGDAEPPAPVDTGLLDGSGQPIMRQPPPPDTTQPVREVTGLRSSLTDDARAARSAGRPAEARIIDQHVTALDSYLDNAAPAELRGQLDTARAARRDYADRFERPQNAIPQVLGQRQGVYDVPDSGVAPRFAQSEEGRLTDLRQLMDEAGGDARVRPALRDQFLANIRDRGLLERPEALNAYLDRHATLLDQLPGLRDELTAGGQASRAAGEARAAADATRRELTTPGRSPEASYLKFGDERTVDAVRTVIGNAQPGDAARRILETAGGSAENARAAFWEALKKESTTNGGLGASGRQETNGLRGEKFLSDPKVDAVAKELYRDAPEQLQDIKAVMSALSGANSATRARRPGSSGTAQGMKAGYEAALSASSIASRVRSINRGQLSPAVAGVDLIATYLRRKSAQIQSGAISRLRDEVVQNPELAARLLEDYNPATFAARRRELQTVYGARATEAIKLLDMAHDEQQRPGVAAVRGN